MSVNRTFQLFLVNTNNNYIGKSPCSSVGLERRTYNNKLLLIYIHNMYATYDMRRSSVQS